MKVLILLILLVGCGEEDKSGSWSVEDAESLYSACRDGTDKVVSLDYSAKFCSCFVEETIKAFTPEELTRAPYSTGKEIDDSGMAEKCHADITNS